MPARIQRVRAPFRHPRLEVISHVLIQTMLQHQVDGGLCLVSAVYKPAQHQMKMDLTNNGFSVSFHTKVLEHN
jgi:hypothetical protein